MNRLRTALRVAYGALLTVLLAVTSNQILSDGGHLSGTWLYASLALAVLLVLYTEVPSRRESGEGEPALTVGAPVRRFRTLYLRQVRAGVQDMETVGIVTPGEFVFRMRNVYVDVSVALGPLHAAVREPPIGTPLHASHPEQRQEQQQTPRSTPSAPTPTTPAPSAPAPRRSLRSILNDAEHDAASRLLAVVGGPGSGKTTLARSTALELCERGRRPHLRRSRRRTLPVLLYLRDQQHRVPQRQGRRGSPRPVLRPHRRKPGRVDGRGGHPRGRTHHGDGAGDGRERGPGPKTRACRHGRRREGRADLRGGQRQGPGGGGRSLPGRRLAGPPEGRADRSAPGHPVRRTDRGHRRPARRGPSTRPRAVAIGRGPARVDDGQPRSLWRRLPVPVRTRPVLTVFQNLGVRAPLSYALDLALDLALHTRSVRHGSGEHGSDGARGADGARKSGDALQRTAYVSLRTLLSTLGRPGAGATVTRLHDRLRATALRDLPRGTRPAEDPAAAVQQALNRLTAMYQRDRFGLWVSLRAVVDGLARVPARHPHRSTRADLPVIRTVLLTDAAILLDSSHDADEVVTHLLSAWQSLVAMSRADNANQILLIARDQV